MTKCDHDHEYDKCPHGCTLQRLADVQASTIKRLKDRAERLMAGNCMGCGNSIDHHYCDHCRRLLAT